MHIKHTTERIQQNQNTELNASVGKMNIYVSYLVKGELNVRVYSCMDISCKYIFIKWWISPLLECARGAGQCTQLMTYRAAIRSRLDYCCLCYGTAAKSALKRLDAVQAKAPRLCCGASHTHYSSNLQKWETLCWEFSNQNWQRSSTQGVKFKLFFSVTVDKKLKSLVRPSWIFRNRNRKGWKQILD